MYKRKGLYFKFATESGEVIYIDAHTYTLATATKSATLQDASATYSGTELFF